MKFVCDRCGKKYATAEDPAPGKVYKLKCKACGHLIVVKGQAGTMTGIPAITAAELAMASAAQEPIPTPLPTPLAPHPEIELQVEPEAPRLEPLSSEAEPVSDDAIEPLPESATLPPEVALAADGAASAHPEVELEAPEPLPGVSEPAPALDPALVPPSPEKDELADFAAAAAEVMAAPFAAGAGEPPHKGAPGYVDLFGDITDQRGLPARSTLTDAFQVAARGSLPDTWSGPAPTAGQGAGAPPTPAAGPAPAPAPGKPAVPRSGLSGTPIAIIGVGMLALVGITAWALLGRDSAPPPPAAVSKAALPTRPAPEVKPPAPAPGPEPVGVAKAEPEPEQKPEPKVAEKRPEPKPEPKPRPPERKPEPRPQPKVAEKRPEPPAVAPAPAPEPRTESRDVEVPDAAAALTQDVVNRVVGANRKAFAGCITTAAESGVKLDGRRVALRITVNTNGTVTYPTLDDQSLNATEMGQCLKSAARLMIFPKFKGDPFHYEVPLILSGG